MQIFQSKTKSPRYEKVQPEPMLKKLPPLPAYKPIPIFLGLKDMGVEVLNQPNQAHTLQSTSEVFNKLYKKDKKFNVKVKFHDKEFDVNNPLLGSQYTTSSKGGGAYYADKRQIEIMTDADPKLYKYRLAHEIGHSEGLGADLESEHKADAFADKLYPGTFFYKNNPYLKRSWQPGYVPPTPLPIFQGN